MRMPIGFSSILIETIGINFWRLIEPRPQALLVQNQHLERHSILSGQDYLWGKILIMWARDLSHDLLRDRALAPLTSLVYTSCLRKINNANYFRDLFICLLSTQLLSLHLLINLKSIYISYMTFYLKIISQDIITHLSPN